MITASIRIARIWGIPIGLHWSWFIIFALITFSLAAGMFPQDYPGLPPAAYWTLGVVTSLVFFASVVLHELGHTAIALRYGVPVREINLFIFGGVAMMSRESASAKAGFWIAIAGPIVSLLLAAGFGLLWLVSGDFVYLSAPAYWLMWINFILAIFNMIPGFPLDGGGVLRAIVWHFNGSLHRATRIASGVGQVVAFGFIAWGVYTMFSGNLFGGLWIAFIGWFLQNAAAATLALSNLEHSLRDVTVKRVMTLEYPRIPVGLTLQKLVDDYLLRGEGRYFIVFDGSEPRGLVTLNEITATPRENWGNVTAGQVMIPNEKLISVAPNTELLTALQIMDEAGVAQVPVNENGQMIGILSREQILRYISLSHSLGLMKALEKSNPVKVPIIPRLDKPAKS